MDDLNLTFLPYLREPAFWWGSLLTLIVVVAGTIISGWITKRWNDMLQFLRPAKPVALPGPQPSAFHRLVTCCSSLFALLVFLALVVVAGIWLIARA